MDGIIDAVKLGNRIKNARTENGYTQAVLAAKTNLSTKYVSNIECGAKIPKLETLVVLANALSVDANTLLADALDVAAAIESNKVSKKMDKLPIPEQRRILHILDVMVEEALRK